MYDFLENKIERQQFLILTLLSKPSCRSKWWKLHLKCYHTLRELQLFRSGMPIYRVCQDCWTGGHKVFPPFLPPTLTILIPKALKVLQNPLMSLRTQISTEIEQQGSRTIQWQIIKLLSITKICKTNTALVQRFADCRYEAVYLLQSIMPIFFFCKLCGGDHMKAGRSTFLTSQWFFFMQTLILWNIWWLKARKRSQKGPAQDLHQERPKNWRQPSPLKDFKH